MFRLYFLILLLFTASVCSAYTEHPPLIISFNQVDTAKEQVYAAYEQLYEVNQQLQYLAQLAEQALDPEIFDDDRVDLDKQFQSHLSILRALATKTEASLFLSPKIIISIKLDQTEWQIDLSALNDLSPEIDLNNAKDQLSTLQTLITSIQQNLPEHEEAIFSPHQSSNQEIYPHKLLISNPANQTIIVHNLVTIRSQASAKLQLLASLLRSYIERNGPDDLQYIYWENFITIKNELSKLNCLANTNLFANNQLWMDSSKGQRHYVFPTLDFDNYQLREFHILSFNEANYVKGMISKMRRFVRDWTIEPGR